MTNYYYLRADDTVSSLVTDDDTSAGPGTFDCNMCVAEARENLGVQLFASSFDARNAGRLTNNDPQHTDSTGYISGPASPRVIAWPAEKHSLFVAVALANGVGGVLRWHSGSASESDWRVISCDSDANGETRMTLAEHDTDAGAVNFGYAVNDGPVWSVVTVADDPTPTSTPATASTRVIPRTSDEAHAMLTLVRSIRDMSDTSASDVLADALQKLRLYLPGGRAEQSGAELARSKSLCEVYERTVSPTLGWTPREGYGFTNGPAMFAQAMERHERERAGRDAHEVIVSFARRYERGGEVNEAILDSMQTSLEGHKRPDANMVLDALGLDTLESREPLEREYEVTVTLTRTRTVTEEQEVTVMVTASDDDEARAMIYDREVDPWDEASDYGWSNVDDDVTCTSDEVYDGSEV